MLRASTHAWAHPTRFPHVASIVWAIAILISSATLAETEENSEALEYLLETGRSVWDHYAPDNVHEHYSFPTINDIQPFLSEFESELKEETTAELAHYAKNARETLELLREYEGGDAIADWLEPRIDFFEAAKQIEESKEPANPNLPQFTRGYWDRVLATRKPPKRAEEFVPLFRRAFNQMGIPTELIWISEVESSMNPQAKSPVGALGPFQFMPETAERFGLSLESPDERTDPKKSAVAAALYLRILYSQFQSWPLAIAAYNAGEGRVSRALTKMKATTFEDVSCILPAETRMYVPKVLATVALRESIEPEFLPGL